MLTFGNLKSPYLNSSDAPDIGGQGLAQAQRDELIHGAGPALVADATARGALVTNTDAFNGLIVVQLDTGEIFLRFGAAWIPLGTNRWVMKRVASQSHTSTGNWQTLDPDTVVLAPTGLFTEAAGTITCVVAGTFRIRYRVQFAGNATGNRGIRLRKATVVQQEDLRASAAATVETGMIDEAIITLAAADTIDVQAFQSSGGNLNLTQGQVAIERIL